MAVFKFSCHVGPTLVSSLVEKFREAGLSNVWGGTEKVYFEAEAKSKFDALCESFNALQAKHGTTFGTTPRDYDGSEKEPCCAFHGSGGTSELVCGGDISNQAGRHSRSCSHHGGGDCTCGASPFEEEPERQPGHAGWHACYCPVCEPDDFAGETRMVEP